MKAIILLYATALSLVSLACKPQSKGRVEGELENESFALNHNRAGNIPNLPKSKIVSLSTSGVACPIGSVPPPAISSDGQAFTILFSQFILVKEANRLKDLNLKATCTLVVELSPFSGSQTLVMDYRGFAKLAKGSNLKLQAHFSAKDAKIKPHEHTYLIKGSTEQDYEVRKQSQLQVKALNRAAAKLTIEVELKLRSKREAESLVTMDSIDGSLF